MGKSTKIFSHFSGNLEKRVSGKFGKIKYESFPQILEKFRNIFSQTQISGNFRGIEKKDVKGRAIQT